MRTLLYKISTGYYVLIIFILVEAASLSILVFAGDKQLNAANDSKKIHISADMLVSDQESMYIEFIGNVRATRENIVVTAHRLKIYYKRGLVQKNKMVAGEQSIEKIVAKGNVKIISDNGVAEADEAIYTPDNRVLVLTGANSKVMRGNDYITGQTITLKRANGDLTAVGSNKRRVEAVFHSGGNILK